MANVPEHLVLPYELLDICCALEPQVLEVLEMKGAWEIWLQSEVGRLLRAKGYSVRLEASYADSSLQRLDILVDGHGRRAAIEMKVESANVPGDFAGRHLYEAGGSDIFKVMEYKGTGREIANEDRFVLVVGHSEKSVAMMEELWNDTPPSHFRKSKRIGVAVYVAFYY
jgi:hypothetical protein